ncbi:MAG TPA: hypothetical protein VGG04_04100 [Candidatus Sulfotelmatobacter sp.]|jgi:hypothetical protein
MWQSDGPCGHPEPNNPPVTKTLHANLQVMLPKASVTVLRGKVA